MLDTWFAEQSTSTRSTGDTQAFLTDQLGGGFIQMIGKLLNTCHSIELLFHVGLTIPHKILQGKPTDDNLDLLQQNGWADELCSLVISLAGHRLKRMSYCLRSWPQRSAAMLLPDGRGQATLDELRKDYAAFRFCREQGALATGEGDDGALHLQLRGRAAVGGHGRVQWLALDRQLRLLAHHHDHEEHLQLDM